MAAMRMAWLTVLSATALAGNAAGAEPPLREVLEKAGAQAAELLEQFRNYVAEERDVQRFYDKSGRLRRERRIRADYYVISLPSAPASRFHFRDVLEVDGKAVRRPAGEILELLTAKGADLAQEEIRFSRRSNRYNLLWGEHVTSNFAAGLAAFIDSHAQKTIEYRLDAEASSAERLVVRFRDDGRSGMVCQACWSRQQEALAADGTVTLDRGDCSIDKVEVVTTLRGGVTLRMTSEFQRTAEGVRLPSRRRLVAVHPRWKDGVIGEAAAEYTNFRKFSAESKIGFVEPR
jgi:hypothetical protein